MKGCLTGWKAVANYIDRSERTAKRYYRELGMPVRRGPNNAVIVIIKEMDTWLSKTFGTDVKNSDTFTKTS